MSRRNPKHPASPQAPDRATGNRHCRLVQVYDRLVAAARTALDRLTDLGIDLDGDAEAIIAGIRVDLHDAIVAANSAHEAAP